MILFSIYLETNIYYTQKAISNSSYVFYNNARDPIMLLKVWDSMYVESIYCDINWNDDIINIIINDYDSKYK